METVILERSSRPSRTGAERKAGELLAQLERDKPKPYSRLENGSLSEYTAVLTDSDIAQQVRQHVAYGLHRT